MESNNRLFTSGHQVLDTIASAFVGKETTILKVFLAILAQGHVLLEDIPGVGKTTLALAFSKALALKYNRMQFTPDVLPSDVTGFSAFNKETKRLEYVPGAVMCNLFLADELNRASSRTQSALLEAMEEGQATVDGVSHPLPQPFVVIATQNPVGASGTQLLPDSQMDRFMIRLSLGYMSLEDEVALLKRKQGVNLLDTVRQILTNQDLRQMQREVDAVHVATELLRYIVSLVGETRRHPAILQGASPRASIALTNISKALAYIQGRDYVTPKDIRPLFINTVAHRLILKTGIAHESVTAEAVSAEILESVRAPRVS